MQPQSSGAPAVYSRRIPRGDPSPGPAAQRATQRLGRRIAEARLGAMQGGEREPSRQVMRAARRQLAKASGNRRALATSRGRP